MGEHYSAQVPSDAEMADVDVGMQVDVHSLSTGTDTLSLGRIEETSVTVYCPIGFGHFYGCFGIMKTV